MPSDIEKMRRIRRQRAKMLAKRPPKLYRLPWIPMKPVEYYCPVHLRVVYPIEWIDEGTWIVHKFQPTTCKICGRKLEVITHEKLLIKR